MKTLDFYSYDNFRQFLSDRMSEIKAEDPKVSFRSLSVKAGLKSQSHLHGIINDKKIVSSEVLEQILKAMDVQSECGEYILTLAQLNQAVTPLDREFCAKKISQMKGFQKRFPLSESQANFYKNWYYPVLFELISFDKFKPDVNWINLELKTDLTAEEVKKAFQDLEKLQVISIDTYGGIKRTEKSIVTGEAVSSHFVVSFHNEMIKKALEKLSSTADHWREVVCVTFALNQKQYGEVRDKVRRFYAEMIEYLEHQQQPDQVYQLNLQLFPITTPFEPSKTTQTEEDS
jgi:uncharacterized protein (TIGR02147 family)